MPGEHPRNPIPRPVQDTRAIAALLAGATFAQAAEAAGISERTLRRRKDGPEFQALLADSIMEVKDRVHLAATSAAIQAIRTLVLAMTSDAVPWPTRVAAAGKVADLTIGTWIRISGPDGEPVSIAAVTPQEELLARLERLAPQPIIEATSTERAPGP